MKLWAYALTTIVAFGLAGVTTGAPADKAEKKDKVAKREKADVQGKIVKIIPDESKPDVKTLVVAKGNARKGTEEAKVRADAATKVKVEGKPGNLGDLTVGQRVKVTSADGTATQVIAMPVKEAGTDKATDKAKAEKREARRAARKAAKGK